MEASDLIFIEDLEIVNGDWNVGKSDPQHATHIIQAVKGQVRQFPLVGVGIITTLNASGGRQVLKQHIRRQLVNDNYSVQKVDLLPDFKLEITAKRLK